MPDIKLFDFEGHDVRITDLDGNPWWVAKDVCGALGIGNSSQAISHLDADERGVINGETPSGVQPLAIINESGLYSLILRSRKPEAKRFKKWITSEVLPAIRKTGGYIVAEASDTPEVIMARAVLVAQETIERLQMEKAQAEAKLGEVALCQ